MIFEHTDGGMTVVPKHLGEEFGRGLLRKIIRDLDVSVNDFMGGVQNFRKEILK